MKTWARVHAGTRGRRSDSGATAVEYAILAAFIGAAVAGIVFVIGQHTLALFVLPPF